MKFLECRLAFFETEIEPSEPNHEGKSHGKGERQCPPWRAACEIVPVDKFPKQIKAICD